MKSKKEKPAKIETWVLRYVVKLKNMMGLQQWTIEVSATPCGNDAEAQTLITYGQHLAVMELSKNFRNWTSEETRGNIVHELLHCHLTRISEVVGEILKPEPGDKVGAAICKSVNAVMEYEIERVIDSLSESICKWLPTPAIPKPKGK